MSEKLEPCPFCGSNKIRGRGIYSEDYKECVNCNAMGPDEENGRRHWNDRIIKNKTWHPISEVPEYDNHVIIKYESGIVEIFYFWATSWVDLVAEIQEGCNEHTGDPVKWCYVPEES